MFICRKPRHLLICLVLLFLMAFIQPCLAGNFNSSRNDHSFLQLQYKGQSVEVTSVQEETWENGAALVVRLTVPVDRKADWRNYLTVKLADRIEPSEYWVLSSDGRAIVYPFVDSSAQYHVSIRPGLPAVNGKAVVGPGQYSVKTRRVEPGASFAGDGYVLSGALKRALPVTTLNIDEVGLDLFRITPEKVGAWSRYTDNQRRQYYQMNEFSDANPLVYSARFPIEHRENQRTTTNLDLSDIKALDKPGAYLAVLRVPGRYESSLETNFFTVSDIGVQIRKNDHHMRVYTHFIQSGKVRNDVTVSLYKGSELIARKGVDENGQAVFGPFHREGQTLVAESGDEITVLCYDRHPLDLSGYENALTRHFPHQVFAWGARNLYRPEETVNIYALLKDHDGLAVDPVPLQVQLFDATGSRIKTRAVNPSESGRYDFEHILGKSPKTGTWRLAFALPGNDKVLSEYEFLVEEFLPERMELKLFDKDPARRRLVAERDKVLIPIQGSYLYGAPASGNKADGFVVAEIDRHPFTGWNTYYFGIDGEPVVNPRQSLPEIALDETGAADIEVSVSNWVEIKSPLALTASISLYETGGRPVTRNTTVTNILADQLVGIEPQFKESPDNHTRPGFKAILTDADGKLLSGKGYKVRLVREDRNYYWTYSDSRGWRWNFDPLDYEVYSEELDFNGRTPTAFNLPVEWGNYRLEVADSHNRTINRFRFSTSWSGWSTVGSQSLKPDQILITFEQDRYRPGDKARAHLVAPVDGRATITVESNDGVIWFDRMDLSQEGTDLVLPIGSQWDRHDLYLTATVLAPGDMKHSVAPKRAFGFTHLPIERADARLCLSMDVPERIEPRRPVTASLQLDSGSLSENPVWVSVAAVDTGVLNITRFKTPDPAGYLFGARRYDYQFYDVYGRIIENAGYDYASQRFGGGSARSEAELTRGGKKPDNQMQIVSLETGPVELDADGRARVSVDVPDFNGRLRWMAVAWSDKSYGSAEAETQVADLLVAQLSGPRFMAPEDESRLTLDISNQSGQLRELNVDFRVDGALKPEVWTREFELPQGSKKSLSFPVSATGIGNASIEAHIRNTDGAIDLRRQWWLGTRSAYPSVTRRQQAVLKKGKTWSSGLEVDDLVAETLQARLVLSSRPPIDIVSHLDALLRYPYGCTEQLASTGLPWALVSPEVADRFGLRAQIEKHFKEKYTDKFRSSQLTKAVEQVLQNQNPGGGFGAWSSDSTEMGWLTVYAGDFLTEAREAGVLVPGGPFRLTLNRLEEYLLGRASMSVNYSRDRQYYEFATMAYAAYVLARSSRAGLSHLRRLYDQAGEIDVRSGLPWAHLGSALHMAGDRHLADKAFAMARTTEYQDDYYGIYNSKLRDMALIYTLLARADKAEEEQLLKLFDAVRLRRWLSTQEQSALFQAAMAGAADETASLRALLKTASDQELIAQDHAFKTIMSASGLDSLESVESLEGTLYINLEMVGEQKTPPEPVSNEISVEKDFFASDGSPLSLDRLASGELVIVRLTVSSQRQVPDGLVVDLLPAGLELENQNLENASAGLAKLKVDGEIIAGWRQDNNIVHVEYLDDRFVAALELSEYSPTRLYYLARAVTPGRYNVPPSYIEDMYRPFYHAIGTAPGQVTIEP